MLRAGVDGLPRGRARRPGIAPPVALGVTVLTSEPTRGAFAERLARRGRGGMRRRGLLGVRRSARCAPLGLRTMVPGHPLDGATTCNDQARVATPADAIASGADWLVIGRTVTAADDPSAAAAELVDEVDAAIAAT